MITLIAALYVLVPAILALAAVLYASFCPVTLVAEDEQASSDEAAVYTVLRDRAAQCAITALTYYRNTGMHAWYASALAHWEAANNYHARLLELRC